MSRVVQSRLPCPKCPSSDAYMVYDDGHGHCYSCNYHFKEGKEFLDEVYTYEYLPWRGVTRETFQLYDCKTKIASDGTPISLGYRYPNGSYKVRTLESKGFFSTKSGTGASISEAGLFGRDKFPAGSNKAVTITEGELDACSLYQVLRSPVVSVQSATSAVGDCARDRDWLNSFENIYIAFDSDRKGREAAHKVAKMFAHNKVRLVKLEPRKDANEYLQTGEEPVLRTIWWNTKGYSPDHIISSFVDFRKLLAKEPEFGVPYPWPTLTKMTYGMRTGETVLFTAQEGIGKTEIMHALEYQLLKETSHAIGAIFLEEPSARHLRAIAGIHLKAPVHLPNSGRTAAEVADAVEEIVGADDRLHLFSHFGSDSPELLLDTIRYLVAARACRFIILDHITAAIVGSAGERERLALDNLAHRLELMVKELDFGLLIVSHVNDEGQTRGSRYISKVADIRVDLNRDVLHPDPNIRSKVSLVVAKNRDIGPTGPAGDLIFDPLSRRFTEISDESSTYPQARSQADQQAQESEEKGVTQKGFDRPFDEARARAQLYARDGHGVGTSTEVPGPWEGTAEEVGVASSANDNTSDWPQILADRRVAVA